MAPYKINIVSLDHKPHHFTFEIGDSFFKQYGASLLQEGSFKVDIELNKQETFLEVEFNIKGTAHLICDRSLEPFDYPITNNHKIVFKYGEEDVELTDEIVIINRDTVSLDVGQFIYEFIGLAVPMKKLHPKFKEEEEDDSEGKIIYSSGISESDDDKNDDENIDPRWEQLKKLI